MKNNIILAIDPGYDRCGVAILEKGNKDTLLFSYCIETDRKKDFHARLKDILIYLEKLTELYKPNILAIEKLYFNSNQKTAMLVAQSIGAIKALALRFELKIYEYTPLQIKIATTGSGCADKKQIYRFLPKLITIDKNIQLDDEYDAIACAITCSASENF